jgi:hypothetical protein
MAYLYVFLILAAIVASFVAGALYGRRWEQISAAKAKELLASIAGKL